MSAASQPARPNRLEHATSPYLQQHANNPVDWYEWGPEALELARRLDKPIFLSIGYSACHWCHVMAHESFENPEVAAVMNELFVNVKVDREERPDLDEIYMRATVILNQGQGGWPMSVWLTPELEPFFAGTYFPPETRWGRPGFRQICARIGELWSSSREGLMTDARRLSAAVADSLQASASQGVFTLDEIDRACVALGRHFDPVHGGISGGGTNKFPPSMTLELFLRHVRRHGPDSGEARRLLDLTRVTLDAMANGGIYDHLGGGFCRYSTDAEWHVPHFEKMLYDQALVGRIYTDAFLCLREPRYERVARGVFDYVLGDLTAPEGGFYSSRDADSEGEEGRYYVWTFEEIEATLADNSPLFSAYYDVRPEGNWRDPHSPQQPKNVLRNLQPLERVAGEFGLTPGVAERRLDAARKKLLEVRSRRVAPHRDEKILVEWNGLMISALARGGAAFDDPRYTEAARKAAGFLLEHQLDGGRLRRAWRDGRRLEMAFLTDYACLIEGLLDLYEATFERRWYEAALELTHTVGRHYWDQAGGGYFFTADDHEALLTRTRDARDGATPSGNSVMLLNLLRLTAMSGDDALRAKAERMMSTFHGDISGSIGAAERFLAGVELALVGATEVAIIGPLSESGTGELLRTARGAWTPNRVLMHIDPSRAQDAPASPLLENRTMPDGRPAAYVCRDYVCLHPATTADELARQLATDGRADR